MDITALLHEALRQGASDLHLAAGRPPMLRVHGDLRNLGESAVGQEAVQALLQPLLGAAPQIRAQALHDLDFSCEVGGLARCRVHLFSQRAGPAAVLRLVPSAIRSLHSLQAPPALADLALRPHGLVLVAGSTGSGKSTTLAAMIDHRNRGHRGHILTIEDPIEFIHESRLSLVNQREVHTHTISYEAALRSAMREDPDVIALGELRDSDSIRLALSAAETGHLVLATLHASSAAQAIDRMVDGFDAVEKAWVRALLSESLRGVVYQVLCKTADGQGRMAAWEVLVGTPAVAHLIREGKAAQLVSVMQSGLSQGMQTLDQHLSQLLRSGHISPQYARSLARFPENL
ncbi:MAG: type IV pilus twitching motility protein PilT [Betaproteobacteria bacterium]|nr:type IV pilus twitching motility protein PilT [Betaproteobacteria bacterium]